MSTIIQCPICGAETILRKAIKGLDADKMFYVCVRYPLCKGRVICEEIQNEEIADPYPSGQV